MPVVEVPIALSSEVGKPNKNGHIYTKDALEQIACCLNEKSAPVQILANDDENVGSTVVGSAVVTDGRVQVRIALDDTRIPPTVLARIQEARIGYGGYSGKLDAGVPHGKRILASVLEVSAVNYVSICDPS